MLPGAYVAIATRVVLSEGMFLHAQRWLPFGHQDDHISYLFGELISENDKYNYMFNP